MTIPLQRPELFTGSPYWQTYIQNDPLTLREATIRFALADARLTQLARMRPEKIRLPALLMLAGRDRIVENRQMLDFFQRIGSRSKQVIQYPAAAHTLEFESERRSISRTCALGQADPPRERTSVGWTSKPIRVFRTDQEIHPTTK